MNEKKTLDSLLMDNWYYTQIFYKNIQEGVGWAVKVVFAKNPKEAKEKALKWAREQNLDLYTSFRADRGVHLYHKNYKREARQLVNTGSYIV